MKDENEKGVVINPPPKDRRCECCGRHISELKPFGGKGDPLVGDFKGAKLVKTFRRMGMANEEDKRKLEKMREIYSNKEYSKKEKDKKAEEEFGDEVENVMFLSQVCSTVEASWECRDCIVLSGEEYFKKQDEKKGERK